MKSAKPHLERSEPKPIVSPKSTSDRNQYATMSSSVSPPMSPSAFSPVIPTTSSPEAQSSKPLSFPISFQGRSISRAATTDSIFRSRSKSPRKSPPTAIDIRPTVPTTAGPRTHPVRIGSEPAISPTSPAGPTSPSRPSTLKKARKTSGTTSHCGRHSNDWLFGGVSLRETVKGIWRDNDEQDH
jgi:hypothetical protein